MKSFLIRQFKILANVLPASLICRVEFHRQAFIGFNERPLEFGFVFKCIGLLYPKRVLDVGTGTTALPHLMRNCGPLVTAIDNIKDYWPSGMSNRHYHILDGDITSSNLNLDSKFDLITCISVLEHIENHDEAIKNMFELLDEGGHLVLTCPYTENEYLDNVYRLPESNAYKKNISFVCQSYSREKLENWIHQNGGEIVEQEFWKFWTGDYWTAGDQIIPPQKAGPEAKHQLTCILIKKLS